MVGILSTAPRDLLAVVGVVPGGGAGWVLEAGLVSVETLGWDWVVWELVGDI